MGRTDRKKLLQTFSHPTRYWYPKANKKAILEVLARRTSIPFFTKIGSFSGIDYFALEGTN